MPTLTRLLSLSDGCLLGRVHLFHAITAKDVHGFCGSHALVAAGANIFAGAAGLFGLGCGSIVRSFGQRSDYIPQADSLAHLKVLPALFLDEVQQISTCNECVQSDMDSVVALLKERVPGYVPAKDEYNGLVEDVLANWEYIWNEAIVYNVLATIVYTNEPKKDFGWYDGLKLLHLVDFAAWQQWCDA